MNNASGSASFARASELAADGQSKSRFLQLFHAVWGELQTKTGAGRTF